MTHLKLFLHAKDLESQNRLTKEIQVVTDEFSVCTDPGVSWFLKGRA